MTCPACDKPLQAKMATMVEPPYWYSCANCGVRFSDPRSTVGVDLFDKLALHHRIAVSRTGDTSSQIRRGWEIVDGRTGKTRLLTWIEIGAITGAI